MVLFRKIWPKKVFGKNTKNISSPSVIVLNEILTQGAKNILKKRFGAEF